MDWLREWRLTLAFWGLTTRSWASQTMSFYYLGVCETGSIISRKLRIRIIVCTGAMLGKWWLRSRWPRLSFLADSRLWSALTRLNFVLYCAWTLVRFEREYGFFRPPTHAYLRYPSLPWPNCGCRLVVSECFNCFLVTFETPRPCRRCMNYREGNSGIGHPNVPLLLARFPYRYKLCQICHPAYFCKLVMDVIVSDATNNA